MRFGLEFLERFDTGPPHQLCGAVYSGLRASKSGVSGLGRSSSKCGPGRAPRCRPARASCLMLSGSVELLDAVKLLDVSGWVGVIFPPPPIRIRGDLDVSGPASRRAGEGLRA